ncbi:LLM class flavin-dependent oxidoreductase [Sphaerisporangium corydalis]|uniref:LLM class flavin-dependent oxidoreductase n=1 Tax=Sphaerisporangium corydalis TaxID=1441875 RepID=A0ABV9ECW5_9ACTN|nr:LLM class flavin-dependent oxidoreductase [Sphaerisporangium corydalis]
MDDEIRLGVMLPTGRDQWGVGTDPRRLLGFATRAEELGFDSVWVNDSLLLPRIEALTMLAAVSSVTERVRLGTAALMPVLRRPVQAAEALASLDLLSGGRLTVTVGAGFPGRFGRPLHELSQVPWEGRFARLDDTVALWRHLWTTEAPGSYHGTVLRFDDLPRGTAPYQPGGPPIWLGGASPSALARTGRLYDGWLPYPPDPADYRSGLATVREVAGEAGRAPGAVTPALFATMLFTEDAESGRRALDAFTQANYTLPVEIAETIQTMVAGPFAHVAEHLGRYVAAGTRHIVCRIAALDLAAQLDQLEQVIELGKSLKAGRP